MRSDNPERTAAVNDRPDPIGWDLVVADAGWFTTANLFRETPADRARVLLLRCADYRVAWSQGKRPWRWNSPPDRLTATLWEQDLVLPTGWMKSYPQIGMRPIARAVRRWRAQLDGPRRQLALVMTIPYYLHLARMLRPDRLVYLNLDDYRLYWPKAARQVDHLERIVAGVADLTACVAKSRAEELRAGLPDLSTRIRHLPHGAPTRSIPEVPQHRPRPGPADLLPIPRPWLGYVGTLEDRVDWRLLDDVATTNDSASIILVGRVGGDGDVPWQVERRRCLARPNVHAVGWRDQSMIDGYNRSFDIGLIPYCTDHPFNLACCPTKIMDYMAAGRPVVSTALPECRLHADLFDVVEPGDFTATVARRLAAGPDDGRAQARWDRARQWSCRAAVGRLLDWIDCPAEI